MNEDVNYSPLPRRRERPLNCLGDAAEVSGGDVYEFAKIIPLEYGPRRRLRKWWEWNYIAECAELLGYLSEDNKALGLGVGKEPLIFFFARHCQKVLATDLYSSDTRWTHARVASTNKIFDSSPISFQRERVQIESADMRSVPASDASYNFIWSTSSIEHVPTLKDLVKIFNECARILKVGGHAILTTEFCLSESPYLLPGVCALDPFLLNTLILSSGAFEIEGGLDLTYNWGHPANGPSPRRYGPIQSPPGLKMEFNSGYRSGTMANMVGLSLICPIGLTLKRVKGPLLDWRQLELPKNIRDYSDAVEALHADRSGEAIKLLAPYIEDGQTSITLQQYTHMFRVYAEAMRRTHKINKQAPKNLFLFLDTLQGRIVQDGDALDRIGALLEVYKQYEEASYVYKLAAASPSTAQLHSVKLAMRHALMEQKLGRIEKGVTFAANIFADILLSTMNDSPDLGKAWKQGIHELKNNSLSSAGINFDQFLLETIKASSSLILNNFEIKSRNFISN
ncbi:class I SAM-dependent methyltransferase [Nitrosococcus oceani]|uniref:class I SAM-dependent methyltransferase n=1 Tax=Nitrosococcus oceani TaxID=1229 RepID=UPI0004E9327D|nr:methyltransferase domain-containing protein [Nitrosococcus oceani]KFI23337.1 hypothetical protein HW44_03645 [Nitrosococcus oceani]